MTDEEPEALAEVTAEDQARAGIYALISRLFYEAPDQALLGHLSRATDAAATQDTQTPLTDAWNALRSASAHASAEAVSDEHAALFVGVGKALITPYTSYYAARSAPDRQLVRLREKLASWDLARRGRVFEMEDHIAGICDVMRLLIEERHSLDEQREFFESYVDPGATPFCTAIEACDAADFYRPVAKFVREFVVVEGAAFDMVECEA